MDFQSEVIGYSEVSAKLLAKYRRALCAAFWLALAITFGGVMDVCMRRDAAWSFARRYAVEHGCRYERGIPYRMVCP